MSLTLYGNKVLDILEKDLNVNIQNTQIISEICNHYFNKQNPTFAAVMIMTDLKLKESIKEITC